jgi:DNA replication protein DnaC
MRIGDLVRMDASGDFRSDVQLSDFDNPKLNQDLLGDYILTVHAPTTYGAQQRSLSARDVLEQLRTIFTVERAENRIVLTANYGHGKSHLALVLANFFGRSSDSPEVKTVLSRLEQALNNPAQFAGYRDFKKSKGEFLVVRLQGDAFGDLQEGFIRALEQALREHDSTRNLAIPLWHGPAEKWLNNLSGERRHEAETFLATQKTDLPSLITNLRRQGAYELVRELAKHITGAYPDFGREVSLEELVIWAVDQVCVPHKLGGLLVLFDEFSLFLQKYVAARTAGKLQELLNGISKRQGKSVFLAFSQQDVDSVTESYAQGPRRDDVKKELERLPKDRRAQLYSLMEGVLAAYLKQDAASWSAWYEQPPRKGTFVQAREILSTHFRRRYTEELKWDAQALTEKVIMGCFPLHPLTTATLSVHTFESGAGDNPRTALQFVRRTWEEMRQQPAELSDGRPNFVFPVTLVDFFGEQLSKKWHAAYRHAVETAPQTVSEEQRKIMQALLVQQAVGLKASGGDQINLLHHLSGVGRDEIKRGLQDLAAQRVIQFDPIHKVSSLWPASTRPQEVEEVIQKAVDRTEIDQDLMDRITKQLSSLGVSSLEFGHASDWSPRQVALTAEMFTAEELRKLLPLCRSGVNGIEEGPRGLVIWLVALTEEEKILLRQNAQSTLNEALGDAASPLPVVIMLPKRAAPGLVNSARRLKALDKLNASEREKIGTVIYQQEQGLAEASFKNSLNDLVDDLGLYADIQRPLIEYALPSTYRASVQALRDLSLKAVVTECYRQAYAYRVEFYTQYAVGGKGQNKLRDATPKVAIWLFGDTAGNSIPNLGQKDIQYGLATTYLTQKWGLLAAGTHAIQRPTLRPLQQAWDLLEETFPPGCRDVAACSVLVDLLNPPYGHDYNTLTLLLAAWIGFHQHDLRLSLNGKLVSLTELRDFFDAAKHPQDFLNRICGLSPLFISRTKPDEIFAQVTGVLEQIRQGAPFTIPQAREALAKLEQAQTSPRLPETKREEIEQLRPRLEAALQAAEGYDRKVAAWLGETSTGDLDNLLQNREVSKNLPVLSLVTPTQPPLEDLEKRWEAAVQAALTAFCAKYASLSDLADHKTHESQLKRARKALEQFPQFAQRVDQALATLSQARAELQRREGEKAVVAQINSMTPLASLAALYDYREKLAALTDLSPQTAQLREEKLDRITTRIQQYERIAVELPQAVEQATQLSDVRQQRDLLLRHQGQLEGTPFHQSLVALQDRVEQIETFFEKLREIASAPQRTPDDLTRLEAQLSDLDTSLAIWLAPAQQALLEQRKQAIANLRRQKTQEAETWLTQLVRRHSNAENPEALLRQAETPPPFLPPEAGARLEEFRLRLKQQLSQNALLQIEALFQKIGDRETRRECLKRLQALVDAS